MVGVVGSSPIAPTKFLQAVPGGLSPTTLRVVVVRPFHGPHPCAAGPPCGCPNSFPTNLSSPIAPTNTLADSPQRTLTNDPVGRGCVALPWATPLRCAAGPPYGRPNSLMFLSVALGPASVLRTAFPATLRLLTHCESHVTAGLFDKPSARTCVVLQSFTIASSCPPSLDDRSRPRRFSRF